MFMYIYIYVFYKSWTLLALLVVTYDVLEDRHTGDDINAANTVLLFLFK